jgi:HEAT repeat protein
LTIDQEVIMALTLEETRNALRAIEPNYDELVKLGTEAIPFLDTLVRDPNSFVASKAAYLASLIQDPRSAAILEKAAHSRDPQIRMAAAAGVGNLRGPVPEDLLLSLLGDPDLGVRKVVLKSLPTPATARLRERVVALTTADPNPDLRSLAREVLPRLGNGSGPKRQPSVPWLFARFGRALAINLETARRLVSKFRRCCMPRQRDVE